MASVPIDTADDVVRNIQNLCSTSFVLTPLGVIIEIWRLANIETLRSAVWSEYYKNSLLKELTTFVVATGTDLNCYPLGYETGRLYDLDGEPVT